MKGEKSEREKREVETMRRERSKGEKVWEERGRYRVKGERW